MSARRKIHLRHPAVVDIGCNCLRPKHFVSSLFSSSSSSSSPLKPKLKPKSNPSSAATTGTTTSTCTSSAGWPDPYFNSSSYDDDAPSPPQPPPPPRRRRRKANGGRMARESVAVVKETSEPYSEFRESMARMIVEKEIYRWDDLNDLLHRFLSLNSPRHHHLILRAFADLWNASIVAIHADDAPPPYYLY